MPIKKRGCKRHFKPLTLFKPQTKGVQGMDYKELILSEIEGLTEEKQILALHVIRRFLLPPELQREQLKAYQGRQIPSPCEPAQE
jgi:hypothetical protein